MAHRVNILKSKPSKKGKVSVNPEKVTKPKRSKSSSSSTMLELPSELLLKMHSLMVKSRVLEERLIKIYKTGEAYFWIGGPGEEAFNVALGLLVHKGQGVDYDYMHLHYRSTPTMVALGMPMIDSIRLIMNKVTDPCTGGRNFSNHYCFPQWNVVPVSSPIEVQFSAAIGTAWVQRKKKSKGLTIVQGGDAGSAEGDFATSLVWSSRKGFELPMLMIVTNNKWGISTKYEGQHGEDHVADRGKAHNIRTAIINGNDPIECYKRLEQEMEYIRKTGKPVLLEAEVSRLYGHSSADGANRRTESECCIESFETQLKGYDLLTDERIEKIKTDYEIEAREAMHQVRKEASPEGASVWDHYFVGNENGDWRKF